MSRERAIYFAGLMKEYLNIPSCVCENIENELINEKYYKVINYIIDRKKELEKSGGNEQRNIINYKFMLNVWWWLWGYNFNDYRYEQRGQIRGEMK